MAWHAMPTVNNRIAGKDTLLQSAFGRRTPPKEKENERRNNRRGFLCTDIKVLLVREQQ